MMNNSAPIMKRHLHLLLYLVNIQAVNDAAYLQSIELNLLGC